MSIHEHDEDIDVVSSPEPSPQSCTESRDRLTSTPIPNRSPALDRTSSDCASPSKPESSSDQGKTSAAAFTSFSINNILSRNENKKDELISAPFLSNSHLTDPSAAMISRYVLFIAFQC